MRTSERDVVGIAEPNAELEMALVREYLAGHQHPARALTVSEAEKVWKDALLYASLRLELVRARAHLLGMLHNQPTGM
jgi:hypothetical protein